MTPWAAGGADRKFPRGVRCEVGADGGGEQQAWAEGSEELLGWGKGWRHTLIPTLRNPCDSALLCDAGLGLQSNSGSLRLSHLRQPCCLHYGEHSLISE